LRGEPEGKSPHTLEERRWGEKIYNVLEERSQKKPKKTHGGKSYCKLARKQRDGIGRQRLPKKKSKRELEKKTEVWRRSLFNG